jgi:hypothetical protein
MPTFPQSTTGFTPTGDLGRSPYSDKAAMTYASISGLLGRDYAGTNTVRESFFYFSSMSYTLVDANQGGGLLIGTFPKGVIDIMGSIASLNFTTYSALNGQSTQQATAADAITGGLNDSKTVNWGFGTAKNTNTTPIATTLIDILPGYGNTPPTFTSSTLASYGSSNPAGPFKSFQQLPSTYANALLGPPKRLDGTTTAITVNFNMDVPTATDIDSDTVVKVDGFFLLQWRMIGNYVLT